MADNILQSLAEYIIAKGCAAGLGVDVFLDYLPDKPDNCVVLNEYDGGAISAGGESITHSVQVIVRGENIAGLKERVWKIFWLFTEFEPLFLLGCKMTVITPRQNPHKFDADEKGRTAYIFNMTVVTVGNRK